MIDYLEKAECREQFIHKYFDIESQKCNKCDLCQANQIKSLSLQEKIINSLLESEKPISYFENNTEFSQG